jgi:hypothetical protein
MPFKNLVIYESDSIYIDDGEFKNRNDLTHVTLPNNLERIGDNAFDGCTELRDINFPGQIILISPIKVNFPPGLIEIGKEAFANCINIPNVRLPERLQIIGYGAFSNCTGLRFLVFDDSLKTIGPKAFESCIELNEVYNIPVDIVSIDPTAFNGCLRITEIAFSSGEVIFSINNPNPLMRSIDNYDFNEAIINIRLNRMC